MGNPLFLQIRLLLRPAVAHFLYLNLLRIVQAQRQLVAVDPKLNRIPHGRIFHHRHIRSRNQPHIQEMLPQRALSSYKADCGRLSDR